MSTTIEIFPTSTKDIKFGDVISLAEKNTHEFFQRHGLKKTVFFQAKLIGKNEITAHPDQIFEWSEGEYAWFSVDGISGGTDAYCMPVSDPYDPEDKWWSLDGVRCAPRFRADFEPLIEASKALDRRWFFRRSAGQPAIINICYGFLAASVAELSGGFLHSEDGAWDYDIFPCFSETFLKSYFQPDATTPSDMADWANRCIDAVRNS